MIPLRRPAPAARIYPEQIGLGEIALAWDAARPLRAWGRYRGLSVSSPASVGRGFVHGPAVTFTGNTTAGLLFNGQDAIAHQQFTAMAIAVWNSGGANNYPQLLGTSTLNNGFRLGSAAPGGGNIGIVKGASAALSTVGLTAGVPFAVVASHDAVGGQYYTHVRRLDTGAIASLNSSNTASANASTSGEFAIGISRTDFSGAWNGAVAMAAMAHEYLPESAALAWLRDPWLLWRAPKSRTYFIPAAAGGGTNFDADLTAGITASAALAAQAAATGALTASVTLSASQAAVAAAIGSLTAGAALGSSASALATAVAALTAGVQAGESWAAQAAALGVLEAGAQAGEALSAQAAALASLAAGSVHGSSFASGSVFTGDITAGVDAGASFARQAAHVGAFTAGSTLAATFLAAAQAAANLTAGITADDVATALAAAVADLTAGADLGAAYTATVTLFGTGGTLFAEVSLTPALAAAVGIEPALTTIVRLSPAVRGRVSIN